MPPHSEGMACSIAVGPNTWCDIRLVGSNTVGSGRVEIFMGNAWGTVCDDLWDATDAGVVCRELGFRGGIPKVGAYFGQGTGNVWMDNVQCTGSETRLSSCQFPGWGNENCNHNEDAGVVCDTSEAPPPAPPQPPSVPPPPLSPAPSPALPPPFVSTYSATFTFDTNNGVSSGWSTGAVGSNGQPSSSATPPYGWAWKSGSTASGSTGPSGGQGSTSKYYYAETSGSTRRVGDIYELAYDGRHCGAGTRITGIQFYYHMYGDQMGTLQVVDALSRVVWARIGQQSTSMTDWKGPASVYIGAENFRFRYIRGGGFRGDAAIDTVSVACGATVPPMPPAAPPPMAPPRCQAAYDLALVIDKSGSMNLFIADARTLAVNLLTQLELSPYAARASLTVFSSTATLLVPMTDDRATLVSAINALTHGGSTFISGALELAAADLMNSTLAGRENVPKVMWLLSDGVQTMGGDDRTAIAAAVAVKAQGVTLFAVGLGTDSGGGASQQTLEMMASTPASEYAFRGSDIAAIEGRFADFCTVTSSPRQPPSPMLPAPPAPPPPPPAVPPPPPPPARPPPRAPPPMTPPLRPPPLPPAPLLGFSPPPPLPPPAPPSPPVPPSLPPPSPPPPSPPPPSPSPQPPPPRPPIVYQCTNTCQFSANNQCDDGGSGSLFASCYFGSDCGDCGTRALYPSPPPPTAPPLPPCPPPYVYPPSSPPLVCPPPLTAPWCHVAGTSIRRRHRRPRRHHHRLRHHRHRHHLHHLHHLRRYHLLRHPLLRRRR